MATITKEQVTKFAIRARKITLLTGEQKDLRQEILDALLKGASIPLDGPYVIDLSQNGGKDFSWETEYQQMRIAALKAEDYSQKEAEALVAQEMAEKKAAAPDKEAVVIGGVPYVGGVKMTPKVNARAGKKAGA